MSAGLAGLAAILAAQVVPGPGAPIAVHLAELGELSVRDGLQLAERLGHAIEARTGRRTITDDPTWRCEEKERCAAEVRARTGASTVLLTRAFGGPTRIRVVILRVDEDVADGTADVLLPLEPGAWAAPLTDAAAVLFPEPRGPPSAELAPIGPPPAAADAAPDLVPWLVIGTGVLMATAAGILAASNADAREELRGSPLPASRHQELADRAELHGITANVLFVASALAAGAGLTLLSF